MNLPDDCRELTLLRNFRDQYVLKTTNGHDLLDEYYLISPAILTKISNDPRSKEIHKGIFLEIQQAVKLIDLRKYSEALALYCALVNNLKSRFIDSDD